MPGDEHSELSVAPVSETRALDDCGVDVRCRQHSTIQGARAVGIEWERRQEESHRIVAANTQRKDARGCYTGCQTAG